MASDPSTSCLEGRRDTKGDSRLDLSGVSPSAPRGDRFRCRGGGWLPEAVAKVEAAGGTGKEILEALCDGGPWNSAGGGRR